jgi:hypothetical protein
MAEKLFIAVWLEAVKLILAVPFWPFREFHVGTAALGRPEESSLVPREAELQPRDPHPPVKSSTIFSHDVAKTEGHDILSVGWNVCPILDGVLKFVRCLMLGVIDACMPCITDTYALRVKSG